MMGLLVLQAFCRFHAQIGCVVCLRADVVLFLVDKGGLVSLPVFSLVIEHVSISRIDSHSILNLFESCLEKSFVLPTLASFVVDASDRWDTHPPGVTLKHAAHHVSTV